MGGRIWNSSGSQESEAAGEAGGDLVGLEIASRVRLLPVQAAVFHD